MPEIASDAAGNFVVVWTADDADGYGVFGRAFDRFANPRGDVFQANTTETGNQTFGQTPGAHVALDDEGVFVVAWGAVDAPGIIAQRFSLPEVSEVPLASKSLVLTDHVPSSPQVRRFAWKVRAANLVSPKRGGVSDPRCNGDPDGTVKATLQVFSLDSGQDTGLLDLPCEKWIATGPAADPRRQGYVFKDSGLDASFCKNVGLRSSRTLTVKCQGRVGGTDFPYDLVGVDEGTVHARLELGGVPYCAAFEGFGSRNGSDGRRFLGKNAAAPGGCTEP